MGHRTGLGEIFLKLWRSSSVVIFVASDLSSTALRQLFALAEAYPDLKANSNFQALQAQLTGIENRLAATRRAFNAMVQQYNSMIQQPPTALLAPALGFVPHQFFNLG